jgi:hypothetical protein
VELLHDAIGNSEVSVPGNLEALRFEARGRPVHAIEPFLEQQVGLQQLAQRAGIDGHVAKRANVRESHMGCYLQPASGTRHARYRVSNEPFPPLERHSRSACAAARRCHEACLPVALQPVVEDAGKTARDVYRCSTPTHCARYLFDGP